MGERGCRRVSVSERINFCFHIVRASGSTNPEIPAAFLERCRQAQLAVAYLDEDKKGRIGILTTLTRVHPCTSEINES